MLKLPVSQSDQISNLIIGKGSSMKKAALVLALSLVALSQVAVKAHATEYDTFDVVCTSYDLGIRRCLNLLEVAFEIEVSVFDTTLSVAEVLGEDVNKVCEEVEAILIEGGGSGSGCGSG